MQLQLQRQLQLQLRYATIHYNAFHFTTLHHYTARHYTYTYNFNCNSINYSYNFSYTTATASTTTTAATTPRHTTPHYIQHLWMSWPLLQPPFGPSVDSLCHPCITTTNLSYRFPIFETSATALCGTTGSYILMISNQIGKTTTLHQSQFGTGPAPRSFRKPSLP